MYKTLISNHHKPAAAFMLQQQTANQWDIPIQMQNKDCITLKIVIVIESPFHLLQQQHA